MSGVMIFNISSGGPEVLALKCVIKHCHNQAVCFHDLVVTIFLGVHQQALLLPAPWSTGVLAAIVVWFVLADLVLEVHRRGFLPIGQ